MSAIVFPLENPVQNYAWGSRTVIAEFLGRENREGRPEAELWIGAHPKAPSRAAGGTAEDTLDTLIANDPEAMLGPAVAARFGGELPFLLKVLAAAEPLSIQCHPDADQAREGFARENHAGLAFAAAERNYRDPHHKPELLVALGPFVALKGFRPVVEVLRLLRPLGLMDLGPAMAALEADGDLRTFFGALLSLEPNTRRRTMSRAATTSAHLPHEHPGYAWVVRLQNKYPGDVGVLSPLLLNLVELRAEEGLFLQAGELHAYLDGVALEVMANSDNVLRGGLTSKYVDLPELLAIARFEPGSVGVLHPEPASPRESVYRTGAAEFELSLIQVEEGAPYVSSGSGQVEVLLGLDGDASLLTDTQSISLAKGRSVFVPAAVAGYRIEGLGRVCRTSVPR